MKKLAILFPGQGSQKVGMGSDLLDCSPEIKKIYNLLNEISGRNISNVFLSGNPEELNQTINTQPSILAVSIALTTLLREKLLEKNIAFLPFATAGHSLGEFSSLWFSGMINLESIFRLVIKRGELMQESSGGAMAAILNLPIEKINEILFLPEFENKIVIANYNSPAQFVISGEKSKFEKIPEIVKSFGGKAIILPVSGAFHSSLMNAAASEFSRVIEAIDNVYDPNLFIYQNIDGLPSNNKNVILDKIKKQMISSVSWTQTINNLVNDKVDIFIEIGPGKVLSGLIKKINPEIPCFNIYDYASLNEFILNYESATKQPTKTSS